MTVAQLRSTSNCQKLLILTRASQMLRGQIESIHYILPDVLEIITVIITVRCTGYSVAVTAGRLLPHS